VNKFTFKDELEPLIEQFLKENLDVFETTVDIEGTNDLAPITVEENKVVEEVVEKNDLAPITEDKAYVNKNINNNRLEYYKGVKIGLQRLSYDFEKEKLGNGTTFSYKPFKVNDVEYIAIKRERGGWSGGFDYSIIDPLGNQVLGFYNKETRQNTSLNQGPKNIKEFIDKFKVRAEDSKNEVRDTFFNEKVEEKETPKQTIEDIVASDDLGLLEDKSEEPEESIQDLIEGLKVMLEYSEGAEKEELENTIEGLKLLL
jgi:hypothetical protein